MRIQLLHRVAQVQPCKSALVTHAVTGNSSGLLLFSISDLWLCSMCILVLMLVSRLFTVLLHQCDLACWLKVSATLPLPPPPAHPLSNL